MAGEDLNGKTGEVTDEGDDLAGAIRTASDMPLDNGSFGGEEDGGDGGQRNLEVVDGDGEGAGEEGGEQAPEEPEYVASLKAELAELKAWKEEQTRTYAEEQERAKAQEAQPKEMTDQDWQEVQKRWGFTTSQNKDTGETELHIEPKRIIDTVVKTIQLALGRQDEKFERLLHEKTSSHEMERAFSELETRANNPLRDIRKYRAGITEYLNRLHHPKDHSKKDFIVDAYRWAKGGDVGETRKKIENNMQQKKRVIHPQGGGGASQGKNLNGRQAPVGDASTQEFLKKFGS